MKTRLTVEILARPALAPDSARRFSNWLINSLPSALAVVPDSYQVQWADHLDSAEDAPFEVVVAIRFTSASKAIDVLSEVTSALGDSAPDVSVESITVSSQVSQSSAVSVK